MGEALDDLRVADLLTLLAVERAGSLSIAARQRGVTRSQVSKAIARLESHYRTTLLARGARGVTLSEAGRRIVPHVAAALRELRATTRDEPRAIELTIAGPSYLVAHVVASMSRKMPTLRVRALELAPPLLRAYLSEAVFDMALVPGGVNAPPAAWTSDGAGTIRLALFGPPALAKRLAPLPTTEDRVRATPFVAPMSPGDRFVPIADDCPLSLDARIVAHEAQTIGTALELAAAGGRLVFGPAVAARRLVATRELVEIPVEGWNVSEPLFVLCNRDTVRARVRDAVLAIVRASVR